MAHQEAVQLLAAAQQFQRMGQADKAIELLGRAAMLSPAFLQVHSTLAGLLISKGRRSEAAQQLTAALNINRGWADGHAMLGAILGEMGQHEMAAEQFQQVVRLRPGNIDALNDLGTMLKSLKRYDEAIAVLNRAVEARPDDARIRLNLGSALHMDGKIAQGIAEFQRAIEIHPRHIPLRVSMGNALVSAGRLDEAIATYSEATAIDPADTAVHSQLLMAMLYIDSANTDPEKFVEESARFNERHIARLPRFPFSSINKDPERRLRIGYFSPDLRLHSVSFFIEPILAGHDSLQFEVFCYADVGKPDAVSERLRKRVPNWRNVFGQGDAATADLIRRDGIDILIDLAGHSAGNRLKVFGHKPAPVQASYMGFANTTGVSTIDYRIVDRITDPPGESDRLHSEKLVRLESPFLCFAPPIDAPDPVPPPVLSAGRITFGSFNNLPKLSPGTIALWSAAMHAVPGSRMLIKAPDLQHPQIRQRCLTHFQSNGIGPDRLEFLGFEKNVASHLARYNQVDIALDSFPYNGTTTTCEALWMGVPVVTLAGRVHASRVGASLLTAVGRAQWIAGDAGHFAGIAAELAGDLPGLTEQRRTLREHLKSSALLDGPGFTKRFESALRRMWREFVQQNASA